MTQTEIQKLCQRLWSTSRSAADDLRELGLSVDVHNDYIQDGVKRTYWKMSFVSGSDGRHKIRRALIGEGIADWVALDIIRAQYAEITDKLHHAPACPANHYCGTRAPTGKCSCGADPRAEVK